MKPATVTLGLLCALLATLTTPTLATTPLYGTTVWGTLWDIDAGTGAAVNPRDTSTVHLAGIEVDSDGTMYGLSTFGGVPANTLFRINPTTGFATQVGWTGLNSIYEGDLALDPTSGHLYGAYDGSGGNLKLFRINKSTGAATVVGPISIWGDYSALGFDLAGNLFAVDTTDRWVRRLDKNSGQVLSSVALSGFYGSITAGMDVDPATGTMYFASGDNPTAYLYTLNTTTGALSIVGATGVSGWGGLAFVPEPSALALLALAAAHARRR